MCIWCIWCICVYLHICIFLRKLRIGEWSSSTLQTWHTLTNMTHFKCCSFPKLWDEICQTTIHSTVEWFEMNIVWLNVFPCKTDSICCTKNRIKEKHPAKDMPAGCTDFQINTNSAFNISKRGAFPCLWGQEEFIVFKSLMSCGIWLQLVVDYVWLYLLWVFSIDLHVFVENQGESRRIYCASIFYELQYTIAGSLWERPLL